MVNILYEVTDFDPGKKLGDNEWARPAWITIEANNHEEAAEQFAKDANEADPQSFVTHGDVWVRRKGLHLIVRVSITTDWDPTFTGRIEDDG